MARLFNGTTGGSIYELIGPLIDTITVPVAGGHQPGPRPAVALQRDAGSRSGPQSGSQPDPEPGSTPNAEEAATSRAGDLSGSLSDLDWTSSSSSRCSTGDDAGGRPAGAGDRPGGGGTGCSSHRDGGSSSSASWGCCAGCKGYGNRSGGSSLVSPGRSELLAWSAPGSFESGAGRWARCPHVSSTLRDPCQSRRDSLSVYRDRSYSIIWT